MEVELSCCPKFWYDYKGWFLFRNWSLWSSWLGPVGVGAWFGMVGLDLMGAFEGPVPGSSLPTNAKYYSKTRWYLM